MTDSQYILGDDYRDPKHGCFAVVVAIVAVLLLCLLFPSCKTVQVSEQLNVRDSIVYHHRDSVVYHHKDSIHIVTQKVIVNDSATLHIQFGQGGGTYNAKTGEATNVADVKQTDTHHEQRDSTAYWRNRYETAKRVGIELQTELSDTKYALEKEKKIPKRTAYDRFCSGFFWVVVVILLAIGAFKVCDKIPATKPYTTMIKGLFKIL